MTTNFSIDHIDPDQNFPNPDIHHFAESIRLIEECDFRPDYLMTEQASKAEEEILKKIEELDIEVLSYDVFDTYLLRNNKPEALRFFELSGNILDKLTSIYPNDTRISSLTVEDLCEGRVFGMKMSYRTRPLKDGCGEGHLSEVLSAQCAFLGLNVECRQIMYKEEVLYESKNLFRNILLDRVAEKFREKGGRVVFISDMYLPADAISEIAYNVAGKKMYDRLYSSADEVVSKRCGKIFKKIERDMGVEGKRFLHIGDSLRGDVVCPREAGWNSMLFPVSRLEMMERARRLKEFIEEMENRGMEARGWAKI